MSNPYKWNPPIGCGNTSELSAAASCIYDLGFDMKRDKLGDKKTKDIMQSNNLTTKKQFINHSNLFTEATQQIHDLALAEFKQKRELKTINTSLTPEEIEGAKARWKKLLQTYNKTTAYEMVGKEFGVSGRTIAKYIRGT